MEVRDAVTRMSQLGEIIPPVRQRETIYEYER